MTEATDIRIQVAQIIEQGMHGIEWAAGKRPSIADLEAILNSGEQPSIQILPDGSITAGEPRDAAFKCADNVIDLLSTQGAGVTAERDAVIELKRALRNMADAYVRKVKTGLTADEIAKEPWRCMEYIEAERLCKTTLKLHFSEEWLREKIKNDPDNLPCEVGSLERRKEQVVCQQFRRSYEQPFKVKP